MAPGCRCSSVAISLMLKSWSWSSRRRCSSALFHGSYARGYWSFSSLIRSLYRAVVPVSLFFGIFRVAVSGIGTCSVISTMIVAVTVSARSGSSRVARNAPTTFCTAARSAWFPAALIVTWTGFFSSWAIFVLVRLPQQPVEEVCSLILPAQATWRQTTGADQAGIQFGRRPTSGALEIGSCVRHAPTRTVGTAVCWGQPAARRDGHRTRPRGRLSRVAPRTLIR